MTLRVVVIGLARVPERAARVSSRLDELGIRHDVFPAVDGARGEHLSWRNYDAAACLRAFGATLLPAEVGCFASHYALWQQCVNDNVPVLIMEDDVDIHGSFPDAVALTGQLLVRFPLIRLAGLIDCPFRVIERHGDHALVRYVRGPMGTQAYALSPAGAAGLLSGAQQWVETVDLYLDRFWHHGVLPHALHPFPVFHEVDAEITSTIGKRLVKRKGWHKFRREVRRLRDALARRWFNLTH